MQFTTVARDLRGDASDNTREEPRREEDPSLFVKVKAYITTIKVWQLAAQTSAD